jgi:hypothetical protein
MGMFDSFVVKHNNTLHEVQTKRFENVLDTWRIGDVINQPSFGVQVLYELAEEVNGKLEYSFQEDADTIIYLVIANGVYVESIVDQYTQDKNVAQTIRELEESWLDTNRQITSFNTHLNAKQGLNKTYYTTLGKLAGYIDAYRKPEEEGSLSANFTKLHYCKLENVKSNSDLIDVLLEEVKEALEVREKPLEIIYDNDPLAKYKV